MNWPSLVRETSSCQTPSTSIPMPITSTFVAIHLGNKGAKRHRRWTRINPNANRHKMSELALTILPETADDALAVERLHERTFGPGRYARSAYRIRESRGHVLDLSFTARIGTLLVGSGMLTPICIRETPALLLGPLTVEPPFREHGGPARWTRRSASTAAAAR